MERSKAAKALTPGEKRTKAKEQAKKRVEALQRKAKKMKEDIKTIKDKVEKKDPGPTGRIVEKEAIITMDKSLQDIVAETVIFEPNPGPQTEFLAAPETDVLFGGAAGGGKSYAMIIDCLRYAHVKGHRALILRRSLKELRELIDNTRELYPQAFPGAKYGIVDKIWTFPSGATVEFGYLERESDVYQYQGQAFSWIGFDEITHLATEFAWNYLASRLRTTIPEITCYMRCTANPGGSGHAWVKKRYIEPAEHNVSFVGADHIHRRFIPARLSDNPYLTQDGSYEKMLQSLPEVHRRRLLEGDWDVNEGSAFPEFDRMRHVIEPFDIPPDWNRVKGVDYGYTSPSACIWAAIHPVDGTIYVYKELYQTGLTGEELKVRMTELERGEYRGITGVLDTAAWNRTGYTGPTIGETLCSGAWGHKLRPADKNRRAGKIQMHEHLKDDDVTGQPKMLFFATVANTIRELTTIPLSKTDSEDVDTHTDDHAYDALRYLLMSRPKKVSMSEMAMSFKQQAGFTPSDTDFGY